MHCCMLQVSVINTAKSAQGMSHYRQLYCCCKKWDGVKLKRTSKTVNKYCNIKSYQIVLSCSDSVSGLELQEVKSNGL